MEPKVVLEKLRVYDCDQCSEKFCSSKDLHSHAKVHIKNAKSNTWSEENFIKVMKCESCGTDLKQRSVLFKSICPCKTDCNNYVDFEDTILKLKLESEGKNKCNKLQKENQPLIKNVKYTGNQLETKSNLSVELCNEKVTSSNNNLFDTPLTEPEDLTLVTHNVKSRIKAETYDIDDDLKGHFTCGQCPRSFKTFVAISTHLIDHSGPPYACMVCPKTFGHPYARNKHTSQIHFAENKFQCSTCLKGFKNRQYLKIHLRVHTGERPYECKECGKRFTQSAALYTHTKIHSGKKEHVCSYCGKAFTEYHNMMNHVRTHTDERPFVCQYCKKGFSDPSALKRHVRTHTGDKIYPCEQCHMRFTDASGLIAHRRRHSGIKKFTCEFCSKLFYTRSELLKHETAVHMNLKRFECDVCAKRFTLKQYLKWHIERNHMK